MRRLEKEREETDRILLQTAVAEEVASRLADEGDKTASEKTDEILSTSTKGMKNEENPNPRSKDAVVPVSEQDLQAMKSWLEALERKLSILEGVRKETEADAPSTCQPGPVNNSEDAPPSKIPHGGVPVQRESHQYTVGSAESEKEPQRRTLT